MQERSRTPFCPNALTPRPRIQFSDMDSRAFDAAQESIPEANRGAFSKQDSKPKQSRNSGLREAGSQSKIISHDRRSTLGSSPQYEVGKGFFSRKAAHDGGSEAQSSSSTKPRKPTTQHSHPDHDVWKTSHPTKSHHGEGCREDDNKPNQKRSEPRARLNSNTKTAVPKSSAVNQGHTAGLCWYMRMQQAEGAMVPTEFSGCVIHPTLVDRPETPSDLRISALKSDSLRSLKSSSKHTSMTSRGSVAGSSTSVESEPSCLSSPTASEASETTSPSDWSSIRSQTTKAPSGITSPSPSPRSSMKTVSPEEEDPFLYIGKYIHRHTKDTKTLYPNTKRTSVHLSPPPLCTCTTHSCYTFLHGRLSRHCRSCRLPLPQPEILNAITRLEEAQKLLVQNPEWEYEMMQEGMLEGLQDDLVLVEKYARAMEERCKEGVWWEGWKILEELRGT